ncbi:MAG: hypothetical protein GEU90_06480 [Gemmatimonas sp.]|nr:hypothetical protein [Gemmatimonas sp.]
MILNLLSSALVYLFVLCCIVSGGLQVLAWSRHAVEGVSVSIRALWSPEGVFDEIGLRQIRVARGLLTLGGIAYLTYGTLLVISRAGGGG